MNAERYLERVKKIDALILNKLDDRRHWVEIAEGLGSGFSSGEGVQGSRNLQKSAEAIGKYVDLDKEIEELKRQRAAIIGTLEKLPLEEYTVLYSIYVKDCTLKEIAASMDKSYGWVKKKKREALDRVEKLIREV